MHFLLLAIYGVLVYWESKISRTYIKRALSFRNPAFSVDCTPAFSPCRPVAAVSASGKTVCVYNRGCFLGLIFYALLRLVLVCWFDSCYSEEMSRRYKTIKCIRRYPQFK